MDILTIHVSALAVASLVLVCRGQTDFPDGPAAITCETYECPPTATCRQQQSYVYCECPYGKTDSDFPDGPADITCETYTCPPTATCRQQQSYVYCDCPYGKTGMTCEEDDPCLPRASGCPKGALCYGQCNPNVVCNGATGIPQCAGCVTGWTGQNCRDDVNECIVFNASDSYAQCNPNVVCNGATGIPQCAGCVTGWTGQNCRDDVNECIDMPDICLNGGQCVNLPGDFSCDCPSGWTGKDCFCKKGTACDVSNVKDKDQYSGVIDINTDLDSNKNTANTGADTDPNNSATTMTISSGLAVCVSLFLLKLQ